MPLKLNMEGKPVTATATKSPEQIAADEAAEEAFHDRVRSIFRRAVPAWDTTETFKLTKDVKNEWAPLADKRNRAWWGQQPLLKAGSRVEIHKDYSGMEFAIRGLLKAKPTMTDEEVLSGLVRCAYVRVSIGSPRYMLIAKDGEAVLAYREYLRPGRDTVDMEFDGLTIAEDGTVTYEGGTRVGDKIKAHARRNTILAILASCGPEVLDYAALKRKHEWHDDSVLEALYKMGRITLDDILAAEAWWKDPKNDEGPTDAC